MLEDQIIYGLISFPLLMILVILIAKKFDLFDRPNNRKIHKTKIVNISGIAIYIYLIFIVASSEFSNLIEQIIVMGSVATVIGFIDDRKELKPTTKLFLLLFPSGYLIFNGFILTDLGSYEHINTIELGKFSFIYTFLAVMLLINSINYIDGTDGLLIGYTISTLLYFYFLSDNQYQYLKIFLIFIYLLIICLIFNFLPINTGFKSFLGDSGSLFIGFFISFTMIFLYKFKNIHPAFLIWACWLPIYDFLYVTIKRIIEKKDFSNPDKSHFHHHIFKYFLNNHLKTFLFINFFNLIIISIGYLVCLYIGKIYSILLFISLFLLFTVLRLKFDKFLKRL